MSCKYLNWEYPNNSQGNPENIKERIYSSATHNNGIIIRHRTGCLPIAASIAVNDAIKSARKAAKRNKTDTLKYAGKYP